jgi:hypothetical protein
VTQITDHAALPHIFLIPRYNRLEEGGYVMTWTSDSTGILFYTVLGMLLMLSSIYVPA